VWGKHTVKFSDGKMSNGMSVFGRFVPGNFPQGIFSQGNFLGGCPDADARLQVSRRNDCDLGHPG